MFLPFSLKPYLRPPGESGEGVLDFFHQQLSFAVTLRYLTSQYNAANRSPLYYAIHARVSVLSSLCRQVEE